MGDSGGKTVTDCLVILNQECPLSDWNNTNISLIPKVRVPRLVSDYRPISLCNVTYKIVAKAIANRMRSIMHDIIDDCQYAFIPGRSIVDNIILSHECLHYLTHLKRRKVGFSALIKLDMSKVYDRVEWSFLQQVMLQLGFHAKWTNLVMRCVSSASFSVILNGETKGIINPSRGLRQGGPLSPYLFLLCSQGLSSLILAASRNNLVSGVSIARTVPKVTHLFFADDRLVFLKATLMNLEYLKGYSMTMKGIQGKVLILVSQLFVSLRRLTMRRLPF